MIRRFSHSARSTDGFTLIELLVVIAIVSLLVSILIPSLLKAKDLAKKAVCSVNIRNVMVAFVLCANENDDRFTLGDGFNPGTFNFDCNLRLRWENKTDPVDQGRNYGYWPLLGARHEGLRITACDGPLQPQSLFCPSDALYTCAPDRPENGFPWENAWAVGHVSYGYRGIKDFPNEYRFRYFNFGGPNTLSDPRQGMAMDHFADSPPGVPGPHDLSYNVGFGDSSVESVDDHDGDIYGEGMVWHFKDGWDIVDERTGCSTGWVPPED
jgi:prepilin-type N-terminal cleavage/methylation domain-containing protein